MTFAEWQVGEVVWTMLWFSLFFMWIWVVITVFADIFRSADLSGVGKALWTLFVIVVPVLGVFAYMVSRGGRIEGREPAAAQQARQVGGSTQAYVR
jgi:hypothetical protein